MKYLDKLRRLIRHVFSEKAIIPWMMTAAIIPIILVSFFAYGIAKDILNRALDNILTTEIQKKIEFIDHYITERKLDIIQISDLPDLKYVIKKLESGKVQQTETISDQTIKSFANYLNHLSSRMGLMNIYIINPTGKILFSLNKDPLVGTTISSGNQDKADLYQAFAGARILQMPYLFVQKKVFNFQEPLHIYLSNAVIEDNHMQAILVMRLDLYAIEQMINRLYGYVKSENTLLATTINNGPTIIMSTKKIGRKNANNMQNSQILSLLNKAIHGEMSEPIHLNINEEQLLLVYRYVSQLNMGMMIEYDRNEVFERIRWLKASILMLTTISLLLVAAIVFWISRALWQANIKSEELLENILPKFVIDELKEKKQFVARNMHNISILFVDIVAFTAYASEKPPEKVVNALDGIFSIFDQLTEQYKLEKIKTIGDAYMAVAGLTAVQPDHANRAVDLGLAMIAAIKHYNINHGTDFKLRVGIDSGTITAGIIGKKKFTYDLWGNAVNRASRMESTGIENQVQITADCYNALQEKNNYHVTIRKDVIVKGLGTMNTYVISNKKD